ncbi:hypothetical protein G7054_g2800 [Neopestalotiopsis clavispora]|nr:hypothetical protein G7054_g2800 [Neopestalotiopsis clavispora]
MAATTHIEQLSPFDLIMPATYVRVLLTFPTTTSLRVICDVLDRGLAKTALQVPWVTGRVFRTTSSTKKNVLQVRWDASSTAPRVINTGSLAATYESLSASGMDAGAVPSELWPASAMIDEKDYAAGVEAFCAGIFRFSGDQGIGLCICAHHNVVDISGLTELLRIWTDNIASPGVANEKELLNGNRCQLLRDALADDLRAEASRPIDELFTSHPEYSRVPPQLPATFAPLTSRMYTIPIARLNALKEQLRLSTKNPPTTNTILCASLWAAITLARMERDPANRMVETSRLVMAVNGRPRLNMQMPGLGSQFLGNLVLYAMAQVSFDDLLACSDVSKQRLATVCDAIATSQSPDQISSRHIAQVHNLVERMEDHGPIFPGWDLFNRRDLTITSWANLPLYNMEFGSVLGKAEFVRVPYSDADGVCIILPRKKKGDDEKDTEAIEVVVMLNKDDINSLEQSGLWQDLVV